jgi:hypothetical protein
MNITDVYQTRDQLAKLFTGVGVEVGVERAHFSKVICETADKLYGVDPLEAYKGYREHVSQDKLDGFYQEVLERMEGKPFEIVRKYSIEAANDFTDESLDFVYIDANHNYDHVLADIKSWLPKVKPGGIVSGHDYIKRKGQDHLFGVKQAVNDYVIENDIPELFIYRGDKSPSWMFIK